MSLHAVFMFSSADCRFLLFGSPSLDGEEKRGSDGGSDGASCWMRRRYRRAIILLIDALRYDFCTFNANLGHRQSLPFENKLPVFNKLLTDEPSNAALYKFMADPPTTTMQRLKGLTTGTAGVRTAAPS